VCNSWFITFFLLKVHLQLWPLQRIPQYTSFAHASLCFSLCFSRDEFAHDYGSHTFSTVLKIAKLLSKVALTNALMPASMEGSVSVNLPGT
jgi:hypothetical protein